MARPPTHRRGGSDNLGLRRALGDRMLPVLVAAMAFLAALALAGSSGAAALVRHWQEGAAAAVTVQVPQPAEPSSVPGTTRLERTLSLVLATPGVASVRPLSEQELTDLLRPWLGNGGAGLSLPLPAVVQVRLADTGADIAALQTRLESAAPGTLVESHGGWVQRLAVLARSLQACAWLALGVVACVSAAVVMVGVRTGLLARRESIEIVHGLGATDGYIANRFAARATVLAGLGGLIGMVASLPVLLALAALAAPFVGGVPLAAAPLMAAGASAFGAHLLAIARTMPPELLAGLPLLPVGAALIGFVTAQATVRGWLRRLP